LKNEHKDSKTILIVNDDGINASGIRHLYDALTGLGDIWVVAPDKDKSGVSHACTIKRPLHVDHCDWVKDQHGWAVHGTPVDAVKLAIHSIMPTPPDLVVSGINRGENSGVDLIYSGTVAAAREGMIFGVPSIAISIRTDERIDFTNAINFAPKIANLILERGLPQGVFLNINVPNCPQSKLKGVRITTQAPSRYIDRFERHTSGSGSKYDWVSYRKVLTGDGEGTDFEARRENFISITPVHAKLTAAEYIPYLEAWKL